MNVRDFLADNDEAALAGCLLFDTEDCLREIADLDMNDEYFTQPEFRQVFQAVRRMQANGQPFESYVIAAESQLNEVIAKKLDEEACIAAYARYHGIRLRDAYNKRKIMVMLSVADGNVAMRMALDKATALLPEMPGCMTGIVCASEWLSQEPPQPEYILDQVFEEKSRVLLVGSSKTRKSFLSLQLGVALAAGMPFLGIAIPRPRRVLLVNLENSKDWQHRRMRGMCETLGVPAEALEDRLRFLNGRGLSLDLRQIEAAAINHHAEVVILDPLYKLDGGADESDMAERKRLVAALEAMTARTGAALVIVHHDAKGAAGDRNVRDRGAGSSIINRDVDATLALTMWSEGEANADNLMVLSILARNAPPRKDMSLAFADFAFSHDPDRTPCKATSKTRVFATPPFNEGAALALVAEKGMTKMAYREAIKGLGGTRDGREAWLQKAFEDGKLIERRKGKRDKLISTPLALELDLPPNTSDTSSPSET